MISEIFSNLNDSMILFYEKGSKGWERNWSAERWHELLWMCSSQVLEALGLSDHYPDSWSRFLAWFILLSLNPQVAKLSMLWGCFLAPPPIAS